MTRMRLAPVGVVRGGIRERMPSVGEPGGASAGHAERIREYRGKVGRSVSEIVVDPRWEELLEGIEGFSHILVLYWPHLLGHERRGVRKVHPMGRQDLPAQGVFATCSPARPNPVLVSTVQLLRRDGNVLTVEGLDAVDGSPVIDIKPYVPFSIEARDPTVPGWMERIRKDLGADVSDPVKDA